MLSKTDETVEGSPDFLRVPVDGLVIVGSSGAEAPAPSGTPASIGASLVVPTALAEAVVPTDTALPIDVPRVRAGDLTTRFLAAADAPVALARAGVAEAGAGAAVEVAGAAVETGTAVEAAGAAISTGAAVETEAAVEAAAAPVATGAAVEATGAAVENGAALETGAAVETGSAVGAAEKTASMTGVSVLNVDPIGVMLFWEASGVFVDSPIGSVPVAGSLPHVSSFQSMGMNACPVLALICGQRAEIVFIISARCWYMERVVNSDPKIAPTLLVMLVFCALCVSTERRSKL